MKQRIRCPCCDSLFEVNFTSMNYQIDKKVIIDKTKKEGEKRT